MFNNDGDAPGSYFIFQYQKLGHSSYEYVRIGNWTERLVNSRSVRNRLHLIFEKPLFNRDIETDKVRKSEVEREIMNRRERERLK